MGSPGDCGGGARRGVAIERRDDAARDAPRVNLFQRRALAHGDRKKFLRADLDLRRACAKDLLKIMLHKFLECVQIASRVLHSSVL